MASSSKLKELPASSSALPTMSTWVRCTATEPVKANWVRQPDDCSTSWTKYVELKKFEIGETEDGSQRLFG